MQKYIEAGSNIGMVTTGIYEGYESPGSKQVQILRGSTPHTGVTSFLWAATRRVFPQVI